ncbi:MAG: hypothetical protein ACI837_000767 [Crocinitomicaceae bacterium]|jgi:hypothetical protein
MLEIEKSGLSIEIRRVFQSQGDDISSTGANTLVSHFGTFSQNLVSSLSEGVEDLLVSVGDHRMVIKRMFSILIEGLQNIRIHGELDDFNRQLGYLLISSTKEHYIITMANIIRSEDASKIISFIDRINNFSDYNLKETYLAVLSNEFLSKKGGAGLGFITTRRKSGNPLGYDFFELADEKQLFSLEIKLSRS